MKRPKYADYADHADYTDHAGYADRADYAEYVDYAEKAEYEDRQISTHHFILYSEFHEDNLNHQETKSE